MGSRIRESADKVFELFVEISCPSDDRKDPVILRKYPTEYDQQDVLTEIPKFAFPCKTEISQVEQFVFVLTDLEGMFRYVYCRHGTSSNTCLCIMSHLQWFDIFYKLLNFVADIVNSSEGNDPTAFLEATFAQDIPVPGVPVTIVAGQHMLSFTVPKCDELPSIPTNRNLTEYYNAVDANNMMKIFASMLHERRIIITSKKLSRITSCVHASEALLYPMHWQHLFIPVLPCHVIDMVTAPMPYVIGVHSSLMETIKTKHMDLGDAVIVDADKNEVTSEHDDLEALPDDVSVELKRQLRTQKVQTSVMESGDAISRAFLMSLVRLIGGYRDALKFLHDGPITFDRDAFIQSRTSRSTQAFLQNMLQLQIFQQFISGRLELLNGGQGFHDVFEQESIKYADHLNTQSKYKEWLAKKTRKLNITDFKNKAAPAVSTAVQTVNVQRKKVMSKLREFNENRVSGQKGRGEGTGHHHSSTSARISGSRPPSRPPPPSASALRDRSMKVSTRSTVYKTVIVDDMEEAGNHGSSTSQQSFSLVNVTGVTDEDMKMTLTRSASVDDLLFSETTGDGDTSSSSSSDAQDPCSASDHSAKESPQVQKKDHLADRLITKDRLIMPQESKDRHEASRMSIKENHFADKLISPDRLILRSGPHPRSSGAPPVPVKRSGGGQRGETAASSSSESQAPPIPRPRRVSMKKEPVRGDESSVPPALPPKVHRQPEKPLIQFDSMEENEEQFDPLMSAERLAEEGKGVDLVGSEDASSTSSAGFLRSVTYRRAVDNRPVFPDVPEEARTRTEGKKNSDAASYFTGGTVSKGNVGAEDPLAELFDLDPFANVHKASTVSSKASKNAETAGFEQSQSGVHNLPGKSMSNLSANDPFSCLNTNFPRLPAQGSTTISPPPRPRPRQNVAATKSAFVDSTSASSLWSSTSAPSPQPSAMPRSSVALPQQQKGNVMPDSWTGSDTLKDWMVVENSGSSQGRNDNGSASELTHEGRRAPKPMQRASVAVLRKQFDSLQVEHVGPRSSTFPRPNPSVSQAQPSSSQWETFD